MPGNIRLYGTTGYVELAAPTTGSNTTLTLPTDSIQPGIVLLNKTDFSAVTSVSLNNVFSNTYDNYRIVINAKPTAQTPGRFRLRTGGTDYTTASAYEYGIYRTATNNTSGMWGAGADNHFMLFDFDSQAYHGATLDIYYPFATQWTRIYEMASGASSGVANSAGFTGSAALVNTTSFDGISFYVLSGTVTGTIRVYGLRNA